MSFFFVEGKLLGEMNVTLITLVPKIKHPVGPWNEVLTYGINIYSG